jgi:hypothetical protein
MLRGIAPWGQPIQHGQRHRHLPQHHSFSVRQVKESGRRLACYLLIEVESALVFDEALQSARHEGCTEHTNASEISTGQLEIGA